MAPAVGLRFGVLQGLSGHYILGKLLVVCENIFYI